MWKVLEEFVRVMSGETGWEPFVNNYTELKVSCLLAPQQPWTG